MQRSNQSQIQSIMSHLKGMTCWCLMQVVRALTGALEQPWHLRSIISLTGLIEELVGGSLIRVRYSLSCWAVSECRDGAVCR